MHKATFDSRYLIVCVCLLAGVAFAVSPVLAGSMPQSGRPSAPAGAEEVLFKVPVVPFDPAMRDENPIKEAVRQLPFSEAVRKLPDARLSKSLGIPAKGAGCKQTRTYLYAARRSRALVREVTRDESNAADGSFRTASKASDTATLILAEAPRDPFAEDFEEHFEDVREGDIVWDPMEPMNRRFFTFNDRLYFWVFKPVGTGYKAVVPEPLRVSIRNFFSNFRMPVRALNCVLQGKMKAAGIEVGRFAINSTLGVFGLGDAAKKVFHLDTQEEDFGQTLGFHGVPPGAYIDAPLFGPLNVRDAVGLTVDIFTDPLVWFVSPFRTRLMIRSGEWINGVSLNIGEYEALKRAAIDPYISVRDAYFQFRDDQIQH